MVLYVLFQWMGDKTVGIADGKRERGDGWF